MDKETEKVVSDLKALLEKAVEKCCAGRTGSIFSAGIDSTIVSIIASGYCDVSAYTVGTAASEDLKCARDIRDSLDFKVELIELEDQDIEDVLPELVRIIGSSEPLQVSVGVPMYFAARAANRDGLTVMISGQGGDELFGGYNRYLRHVETGDLKGLADGMNGDVRTAWADNLNRDVAICKAFGIDLRFPYMDEEFGRYVMDLPGELKIKEVTDEAEFECVDEAGGKRFIRKYIQRHLARTLDVPEPVVCRKKKAAQYGSESEKAINRIAKKNGFKDKASREDRRDYARMYLESLA